MRQGVDLRLPDQYREIPDKGIAPTWVDRTVVSLRIIQGGRGIGFRRRLIGFVLRILAKPRLVVPTSHLALRSTETIAEQSL